MGEADDPEGTGASWRIPATGRVEVRLRRLADSYHRATDGLFDDEPDLRIV